jgi:hypothetical protein
MCSGDDVFNGHRHPRPHQRQRNHQVQHGQPVSEVAVHHLGPASMHARNNLCRVRFEPCDLDAFFRRSCALCVRLAHDGIIVKIYRYIYRIYRHFRCMYRFILLIIPLCASLTYASCLFPCQVCLLCLHARVGLDCSMGWVPRRMQPVEERLDMYEHSAACRYLATWDTYPGFLKFWVPFVTTAVFASLFMIEFRIAYAFIFEF